VFYSSACGNASSLCFVCAESLWILTKRYFHRRIPAISPRSESACCENSLRVSPLPPRSLGILKLAGKCQQNTDSKRLRCKNLRNKGVTPLRALAGFCLRLDHDGPIAFETQGQMSQAGSESRALRSIVMANAFDPQLRASVPERTAARKYAAQSDRGRARVWRDGPQRL
jgi:hypothetical protein